MDESEEIPGGEVQAQLEKLRERQKELDGKIRTYERALEISNGFSVQLQQVCLSLLSPPRTGNLRPVPVTPETLRKMDKLGQEAFVDISSLVRQELVLLSLLVNAPNNSLKKTEIIEASGFVKTTVDVAYSATRNTMTFSPRWPQKNEEGDAIYLESDTEEKDAEAEVLEYVRQIREKLGYRDPLPLSEAPISTSLLSILRLMLQLKERQIETITMNDVAKSLGWRFADWKLMYRIASWDAMLGCSNQEIRNR